MASTRSFRERGGDFSSRRGGPLSDEVVRPLETLFLFFSFFFVFCFGKKKVVGDDEKQNSAIFVEKE